MGNDVAVQVLKVVGTCRHRFHIGEEVRVRDLVPGNLRLCALNKIYPYWLTFSRGGNFPWIAERGTVTITCPNVDNGWLVEIHKGMSLGEVLVKVVESQNSCLEELPPNHEIALTSGNQRVCMHALNDIFLFLGRRARGGAQVFDDMQERGLWCKGCHGGRVRFGFHD